MKIKITADSTCDLIPELVQKYDIRIIPLHIIRSDGADFLDGDSITPSDIFRYVDLEGKSCHTAAINIEEFERVFSEELTECDAVIHFDISSDFSACYQNACIAAEGKKVYVIDSRNLSSGIGMLIISAAEMAAAGKSPEEITAAIDMQKKKLEVSFIINTLRYLHKGGRCSAVATLGANILQLKPCIEVLNGKMDVGKKYRGNFEKSIKAYINDRLLNREDIDGKILFITFAGVSPETITKAHEYIDSLGIFDEIFEAQAGCTVSNHCGPGTFSVMFSRK